jgi:hypothetical protein
MAFKISPIDFVEDALVLRQGDIAASVKSNSRMRERIFSRI